MASTHNVLVRAIRHAGANDRVGRNVASLVKPPQGKTWRPSRAMTAVEAAALLVAAKDHPRLGAYVILSLTAPASTAASRAGSSPAGLIVTSWLQGTSRDGDPPDHIHNQIARVTRTFRDSKWRALDTMSLRAVLGALQAIAATTVECELTREFGVEWIPRADGRGNEIKGISQAQMDAYSTRTMQVREKERELAQVWERKHGRAPTSRELLHVANAATLRSRKGKEPGVIDWDALAQRWDAALGGALAGIAPAVSDARGPGTQAGEHHVSRAPSGPPAPEAQARVLAKALVLVSGQHPAWTRHNLVKQLALVLPVRPGDGVADHEVTPKAPWTGSGWRGYSYGEFREATHLSTGTPTASTQSRQPGTMSLGSL